MPLRCSLPATCSTLCLRAAARPDPRCPSSHARLVGLALSRPRHRRLVHTGCSRAGTSDSKAVQLVLGGRARGDDGDTDSESSDGEDSQDRMTDEERKTLRRKIREMMDRVPETAELTDPEERRAKMRELLTKYELVVEEEDPEWPEDAEDGMGFNLGQFFDRITIKAEKKDDAEEEDDSGYQSDKEIVWEDDNYIKPVRDVRTQDWDASVFTDFGPMIVLVHNRYKRPQENEMARAELTKAIEMFWEHNLPSPRCVAVDACAEPDLVDALKVSGFPEILFTNAGRIIHREKVVRSAEAWSRMMAFFYYKAARPPFLCEADGKGQEKEYLQFEIDENEFERTRQLYERLLDRTKHLKVWISYAEFEASAGLGGEDSESEEKKNEVGYQEQQMERVQKCRAIFERAFDYFRTSAPELKEERAMLLEEWINKEVSFGDLGDVSLVQKKAPRKVKRKRPIPTEDGSTIAYEEYIDYVFPDEVALAPNLKILEAAYKWKKQKTGDDDE